MAPFIHLSLLLATIQLPLVSATPLTVWLREGSNVTFKFPTDWTATHYYRDDKCECVLGEGQRTGSNLTVSNKTTVTTDNLKPEDSGSYLFRALHPVTQTNSWCLSVKVTTGLHFSGCTASYLSDVDFSEGQQQKQKDMSTEADCMSLCTNDSTCQYFTFNTRNKKCFPMPSSDNMVIKLNKDTISGYPLRNCCSDINDNAGLQFHQEAKSWIDALEHCQNQTSSLVQITSQTVQDAVNVLLQNKTDWMQNGVWIGLERSIFSNRIPWKWISGSEAEYLQWNSSFLVDKSNNHCGKIIWVEESKFNWLDANCNDKLPFICQHPT